MDLICARRKENLALENFCVNMFLDKLDEK